MKITFISDTHTKHEEIHKDLPGGDLIIHAGDFMNSGYDPIDISRFVNEQHIVAACAFFENTQLFMTGGHIIVIEESYYTFVRQWMQLTQHTTSKGI